MTSPRWLALVCLGLLAGCDPAWWVRARAEVVRPVPLPCLAEALQTQALTLRDSGAAVPVDDHYMFFHFTGTPSTWPFGWGQLRQEYRPDSTAVLELGQGGLGAAPEAPVQDSILARSAQLLTAVMQDCAAVPRDGARAPELRRG